MRDVIMMSLFAALLVAPYPVQADDAPVRPKTEAALIEAAMDAIQKKDAAAYVALYPTVDEVKEHCPETMNDPKRAAMVQNLHKDEAPKVRKKIERCHELIDFTKAVRIRVEGGGNQDTKPEKGCEDLYGIKDIKVYLRVGEKTFRVKIDDPIVMGTSEYGVTDDPRCTEAMPTPQQ